MLPWPAAGISILMCSLWSSTLQNKAWERPDGHSGMDLPAGLSWSEQELNAASAPHNKTQPPWGLPGGIVSSAAKLPANLIPQQASSIQHEAHDSRKGSAERLTILVVADAHAHVWLYAGGTLHLGDVQLSQDQAQAPSGPLKGKSGQAGQKHSVLEVCHSL